MFMRPKRWLIRCGLVFLAGAVALVVLEWGRRWQASASSVDNLDGSGAAISAEDLEEQYGDPEALARLCAGIQERCHALRQRFLKLRHTRKTRQTRYDSRGGIVALSEARSHVQFRGCSEQKQEIERRQLLGEPSLFDPDKYHVDPADNQMAPPFSKDSPEGLYRYRMIGVEELQGRRLLRVSFEPSKPIERSFKGSAWIDPDTHEPVRMQGSLAKAKFSVDHFDMLLDYGPSENGHNQLRRVVMDMAGGFALLSLHYRIESELSDYRVADE